MPYPAIELPSEALPIMNRAARSLRAAVKKLRDASEAGDTERLEYVHLMQQITNAMSVWDAHKDVQGLAKYAKDQNDDVQLDVVAEYANMRSLAVALRAWVDANLPKSGDFVLLQTLSTTGNLTSGVFTSAQTAVFRTEADALIAAIDIA